MWTTINASFPIFSLSFLPLILIALTVFTQSIFKLIFFCVLISYCVWVYESNNYFNLLGCMILMSFAASLLGIPIRLLVGLAG